MLILTIAPKRLSLVDALGESASMLALAESMEAVVVGAWVIEPGPTVCLGALQVAGRVLADPVAGNVLRRSTTGAAAFLDGGLLVSLALPTLDAIHRDTTPRTILNRNVRPLLAGFRHAGIAASYLGRDFISVARRPFALLGIDGSAKGAVLIEALASGESTFALPAALATDLEVGTHRLRDLSPISLEEASRDRDPEEIAGSVLEGIAVKLGAETEPWDGSSASVKLPRVLGPTSPLEGAVQLLAPQPIPMGWLDLALVDGLPWIGGDVLAPAYALGSSFELAHPDTPMEGAEWDDVRRASELLSDARSAGR